MIKKILIGLLAVLVILQLFQINKSNPDYPAEQDYLLQANAPEAVSMLLKDACYDCHSYETKYPWYAYVQPVGWWLKDHIDEGRGHLNFSEWTTYPAKRARHKLEESYEEVENGHMPLKSYPIAHPEARLTDEQRALLVDWFKDQYHNFPDPEANAAETTAPDDGEQHEDEDEEHEEHDQE